MAAAYVDNVAIIGACKKDTEVGYERVCTALRDRGFVLHDLVEASREVETVGIVFEGGSRRRLRAKPARTWRIYQSISFLLQRRGCTGHIMEKLLGHVVNHFMLARSAMSALDLMYKFIDRASTHSWQRFDMALCHELKVVQGLLFLAEVDMAAPRSEIAFCGDSSKKSYALSATRSDPTAVISADQHLERWRFVDVEEEPPPPQGTPLRGWAPAVNPAPTQFESWLEEQAAPAVEERRQAAPARRAGRKERRAQREVTGRVPRLEERWAGEEAWTMLVKGGWRFKADIQEKEGRVVLLGLRRAVRCRALHGRRLLSLCDNMSCLMALVKGRGGNPALLSLCRKAASCQLGAGIRWSIRYIESERNGTDYDSRAGDRGELGPGDVVQGGKKEFKELHETAPSGDPSPGPRAHKPPPRTTATTAAIPAAAMEAPSPPTTSKPPGAAVVRGPGDTATTTSTTSRRARRRAALKAATRAPAKPPRPRRGPAVVELYAGCARLTAALRRAGVKTVVPFERDLGRRFDLDHPRVRKRVEHWIKTGAIWYLHLGTPCTLWSVARRSSQVHASKHPGFGAALYTLKLIRLCEKHHVVWTLENPASSGIFRWEPLERLAVKSKAKAVTFDCCAYGSIFMKPTTLLGTLPGLDALGRRCKGNHWHEHLQGTVTVPLKEGGHKTSWRTSLAGRYNPNLCRAWAQIARQAAPRGGLGIHAPSDGPCLWEAELARDLGEPAGTGRPEPELPRGCPCEWAGAIKEWGGRWGWCSPRF